MLVAFLLATIVVPAVLAYLLRRTLAWWVAGVAVAGLGVYLLSTLDHERHNGVEGAWSGIGNFVQEAYGEFMLVYAAILLLVVWAGRRGPRLPPSPPAKLG